MNSALLHYPISSEIETMLRQSPLPDLRHVQVEENDAEIVLTGLVPSYYLKQLAQETVRSAIGQRVLRNRVVVERV